MRISGIKQSFVLFSQVKEKKENDLTQVYERSPYTNRKFKKQMPLKTSSTQRLRTDLGR